MSKFNGSGGRKPSTEARRYVYKCIATTLEADISNGSEWLSEDMNEFDRRRVLIAVKKVVIELRKKAVR